MHLGLIAIARKETPVAEVFGVVQSEPDIVRANEQIRGEMATVSEQWDLTQFKRRSDYICKLAAQPVWRQRFGAAIADALLTRALDENRKTVDVANRIAREKTWNVAYSPWRPTNLDVGGSERPG
jgi:hypothetical protein